MKAKNGLKRMTILAKGKRSKATFDALRNSGARPGDVVAIQGVGGLGHLAIQYAKRMGFKTLLFRAAQIKRI